MKGVMLALLGTDGSGKSSVIMQLIFPPLPGFQRTKYIHLRPRLGFKTTEKATPVTDPHRKASRSSPTSIAKILYLLFDYGVGYVLKVLPLLMQSTLVVFDRYYHDILVDPKRYRYGGPMRLARWVGKMIPKPDLFILLDAPPEILQVRKQEVAFEETARQREAYLEFVRGMKNGVVVDASIPLDEVVAEVNRVILDFMAKRTKKRLGL